MISKIVVIVVVIAVLIVDFFFQEFVVVLVAGNHEHLDHQQFLRFFIKILVSSRNFLALIQLSSLSTCLFWLTILMSQRHHIYFPILLAVCVFRHYVIQGKEYNMSYYLADGIYPKQSTIVQTIRDPHSQKKKYFAIKQESC